MIFWHESSATEPGGTARDGRAHEPGAANIPAMPVAGISSLISVPQAGRGRRGGSCDYGADRSALSGAALLWLAPDGGMAGNPRPSRQPQAGAAPDAAVQQRRALGAVQVERLVGREVAAGPDSDLQPAATHQVEHRTASSA